MKYFPIKSDVTLDNHVSEDTLITSRMLPSGIKGPSAGVMTHAMMTVKM